MDQMISTQPRATPQPFNGPIEIGLRSLFILTAAYPSPYSLQQLVIFDYLVVHSDDIPNGPDGLHPQTPHRSGEILVRRGILQDGLSLYQSRGLIDQIYQDGGVFFSANEKSAGFLDALNSEYALGLRERAIWGIENFGGFSERELGDFVHNQISNWGAEFSLQSVLWQEESL
ncbi:ABC-three component system middle component 2 [Corallococcus aberystwythensis]|uniref:ABC-three component system middle component 2 n=1 Tax=Corallococcus aberystwythensis TaxID=2316722 RepID=UPI0011C3609B|nr:ABC-three component system middle component 2 [Corallococcus aberystwythensis]